VSTSTREQQQQPADEAAGREGAVRLEAVTDVPPSDRDVNDEA
jgi:hypothetical protein